MLRRTERASWAVQSVIGSASTVASTAAALRFIVPPAAAMLGVVAGLTMAAEAVPGRGVWYVHRVPFLRVDLAGSVRRAHGEPVYRGPRYRDRRPYGTAGAALSSHSASSGSGSAPRAPSCPAMMRRSSGADDPRSADRAVGAALAAPLTFPCCCSGWVRSRAAPRPPGFTGGVTLRGSVRSVRFAISYLAGLAIRGCPAVRPISRG